jgi:NhaP-type Na+/H+ or K+/H+ antiporter
MSEVIGLSMIAMFIMFIVFIALETCQEKYKCTFGHQASYILIIGISISAIIRYAGGEDNKYMEMYEFNDELFFYVCLPPIIFASGFNMQRGNFFANLKMVLIFGVLGTIVSFTMFSLMTVKINEIYPMEAFNGKSGKWEPLKMEAREIILMSSLLCSSDVIAAVSLVSYDKEPKLFSIIFGEGITNDAVSIILFNTVLRYTTANTEITWSSPFSISGGFMLLGLISVLIGMAFGLASSLFLKYFRSF